MNAILKAIRDAICAQITSIWAITVIAGDDESDRTGSYATVHAADVSLLGVYATNDEYTATFEIAGVFTRASGDKVDEIRMSKAGAMRDALVIKSVFEGLGHLAKVTSLLGDRGISIEQNQFDVGITFEISFTVNR